jgi:hypothetical protein
MATIEFTVSIIRKGKDITLREAVSFPLSARRLPLTPADQLALKKA